MGKIVNSRALKTERQGGDRRDGEKEAAALDDLETEPVDRETDQKKEQKEDDDDTGPAVMDLALEKIDRRAPVRDPYRLGGQREVEARRGFFAFRDGEKFSRLEVEETRDQAGGKDFLLYVEAHHEVVVVLAREGDLVFRRR